MHRSVIHDATVLKDSFGKLIGALGIFRDTSEMDSKDRRIQELSKAGHSFGGFHGMVGKSNAMKFVCQIVEKAVESDAPVVIYGESGTGEELVVHALHKLGLNDISKNSEHRNIDICLR